MSSSLKPFLADLDGALAKLERRANEVLNLTNKVRHAFAGAEREHILAAVYHQDTLVITVDSAAWSAQIRFAQDELRRHLAANSEKIFINLKVRVGHGGEEH